MELMSYVWMVIVMALFLTIMTGNKWIKILSLLIKGLASFVWDEIWHLTANIYEKIFGPPDVLNSFNIPVEMVAVNSRGIPGCPNHITVDRLANQTLQVIFDKPPERRRWVYFRACKFEIGSSGRIKSVIIDYPFIRARGMWLRQGCETADWREYISSVVQAHLEVLKFEVGKSKRSRHPIIVSRIFRHYANQIFQEVA